MPVTGWKIWLLLGFCWIVFGAAFWAAFSTQNAAAYYLAMEAFACLVMLYAVGLLGLKVGILS